mgnify:FL=1
MSAIFGLIHFDGQPVEIEALRPALDVLAHRGPDGQGRWHEGSVLLAHWMLHTTPESLHEQQPLVAPEGDLVLVADARIDNRDELLAALGLRSTAERPVTDAELILAAYRRWGADCPDRLLGDFAFAIWDRRHRRLFAARDGMGVRPFYYFHDGRRFAFATLLPAVRMLPDVPQDIDEEMILRFLTLKLETENVRTFYRVIRRLPGGHALQVDSRELHCWRYWRVDLEQEVHFRSETEYVEAFRACFEEAVRCRLRSAFPVGTQLSGGLDSSSVTGMAAHLLKDQVVHAGTAVFEDVPETQRMQVDERQYADAVVRRFPNLCHHLFHADRVSPLIHLDKVVELYGQPFFSANYHIPVGVAQTLQSQGVRVILSGLDGDSVLTYGWARLADLFYQKQWEQFAQEVEAFAKVEGLSPQRVAQKFGGAVLEKWARSFRWKAFQEGGRYLAQRFGIPFDRLVLQTGIKPWIPIAWRRKRARPRSQERFVRFSEAYHLSPLLEDWLARQPSEQASGWHPRRDHWEQLTGGIWQWVLEFANARVGWLQVEERFPFFDRRVVTLSVQLPLAYKLRHGWARYLLRMALEGMLPPEVQWRSSKANIGYGFTTGLLRFEKARIASLIASTSQLRPFVEPKRLRQAWEHMQQHKADTDPSVDMALYLCLILHQWLTTVSEVPVSAQAE